MKKIWIPIFTEEYGVNVFFGKRDEVKRALAKYTTYSLKTIDRDFGGRGCCFNCYPDSAPIMAIDGDLKVSVAMATIAHEACHAVDYLMEYVGIDDRSGEFRAHGVASIMRKVLAQISKS